MPKATECAPGHSKVRAQVPRLSQICALISPSEHGPAEDGSVAQVAMSVQYAHPRAGLGEWRGRPWHTQGTVAVTPGSHSPLCLPGPPQCCHCPHAGGMGIRPAAEDKETALASRLGKTGPSLLPPLPSPPLLLPPLWHGSGPGWDRADCRAPQAPGGLAS